MENNKYLFTELVMDKDTEKKTENCIIKRDLKVEIVENGIIYPVEHVLEKQYGGVTDSKGNFIELSLLRKTHATGDLKKDSIIKWQQYEGANPKYDLNEIEYIDEDVVYIGVYHKEFGHLLLETISRLWFYLKDTNNFNYKAVFIDDNQPNTNDTFNELMELFGLAKENLIQINKKPIRFRSIIVPEQSMVLYSKIHRDYKLIIERIKSNVTKVSPYKRVLFSKARDENNRVLGSKNIDKIFEKNGYKVIYPEELSLYEKISILKSCDMFVCCNGSTAIISIFLRENSRHVRLSREAYFNPYLELAMDSIYNINVMHVDAYLDVLPTITHGPFIFGANQNLINFFDHYKFEYDKNDLYKNHNQTIFNYLNAWSKLYSQNDYVKNLAIRTIDVQVFANNLVKGSFFDGVFMPNNYIDNSKKKSFNIFAVHIDRKSVHIYIFGIRIAFKRKDDK